MLRITCINCGKKYRVKEKLRGETLKCPNCGTRLQAESNQESEDVSSDDVRSELIRLAGGGDEPEKKQKTTRKKRTPAKSKKDRKQRSKKTKKSSPTSSSGTTSQKESDTADTDTSVTDVELEAPRKSKTALLITLLLLVVLGLGGTFAYTRYQSYVNNRENQQTVDAKIVRKALQKAKEQDDPCQRDHALKAWNRVRKSARQYERTYGDGQFVDAISQATSRIQHLQTAQRRRSNNIDRMRQLLKQSKVDIQKEDYSSAAKKLQQAQQLGQNSQCKDDEIKDLLARIKQQLDKPVVKYGSKGWVKYKGEWMPPARKKKLAQEAKEKRMREKGLVKYKDRWVKPETRDKLEKAQQKRRNKAVHRAQLQKNIREKMKQGNSPVVLDPGPAPLRWRSENWSNPCKLDITQKGEDDIEFVSVQTQKGDKNKWVVSISQRCNLEPYDELRVDLISQDQLKCAIGIWSHPGYKLHEGKPKTIQTDATAQTVVFDLTGEHFKSKKSKWRYTTSIQDPQNVYKFSLFFYNQTDQPIYLRNMRVLKSEK